MHFTLPLVFTALLFATGSVAANIPQFSTETSAALASRADGPGRNHDQVSIKDRSIVDGTDDLKDLSARDYHSPSFGKSRGIHAKVHEVMRQVHRDFLGDQLRVMHLAIKHDATDAEKHNVAHTFERHLQVNIGKVQTLTKDVVAAKQSGLARRQDATVPALQQLLESIGTLVQAVLAGVLGLVTALLQVIIALVTDLQSAIAALLRALGLGGSGSTASSDVLPTPPASALGPSTVPAPFPAPAV
ncbi:unnamed protein product [Tilletia controversa]|uniref:Uncharacterized protein n=3 Tax=Tilletia TaxID=13289 RepID=A0A8X7SV74_9BASI|nr:hypothetical protein CF336_g6965 [Tilletia laevis]KAE8188580.1 hypothetical protein CF328_g6557 [Tilletia controversa]KAE8251919.1 hypothetical protein A4X03_0g6289 [Tilletia caries]KAE8190491.1 hypothetical protein CF335_g6344 [Tilletia laevis]KAE8244028.1 hypothetical protein A4X06_0g6008 [Tilletia controversa]